MRFHFRFHSNWEHFGQSIGHEIDDSEFRMEIDLWITNFYCDISISFCFSSDIGILSQCTQLMCVARNSIRKYCGGWNKGRRYDIHFRETKLHRYIVHGLFSPIWHLFTIKINQNRMHLVMWKMLIWIINLWQISKELHLYKIVVKSSDSSFSVMTCDTSTSYIAPHLHCRTCLTFRWRTCKRVINKKRREREK